MFLFISVCISWSFCFIKVTAVLLVTQILMLYFLCDCRVEHILLNVLMFFDWILPCQTKILILALFEFAFAWKVFYFSPFWICLCEEFAYSLLLNFVSWDERFFHIEGKFMLLCLLIWLICLFCHVVLCYLYIHFICLLYACIILHYVVIFICSFIVVGVSFGFRETGALVLLITSILIPFDDTLDFLNLRYTYISSSLWAILTLACNFFPQIFKIISFHFQLIPIRQTASLFYSPYPSPLFG